MTGLASSENSSATLQERLRDEQVLLLCRQSRVSLIASVLCGIAVCLLLLREKSVYQLAAWLMTLTLMSVVRGMYQDRMLRRRIAINSRNLRLLFLGLALHGLVWSLPSTWLLPQIPSSQVMLAMFMVGISATSMSSLASVRSAYATLVSCMMLPIAGYYFALGGEYAASAVGIVVYLAFMVGGAQRQTAATEHLLRLQLENAALAANIQREKEVVERSNRELQLEIEQRERTEAALRISSNEAQAANRAKSQFLANMSHELRTPLNGILGMSDLLLRSLASPEQLDRQLKYAQTIRSAGERLLHLINDILDMARIEAGALRLEHHSFSLRDLVDEVVDLTSKQCNDKGLKLTVNVYPQVPTTLRGDANRLRQVLLNLVANAIKFTDEGGVDIRVERMTPSGDGARVILRWTVSDTGAGIAERARAQLFKPFSQIDDSNTRKHGGSGLGLAICHQLVQAMDGRIDVESHPGRGSTFWFELPFDIPLGAQTHEDIAAPHSAAPLRGRILVAEDNATNLELVAEMLELAGCQAVAATNGREALERLRMDRFDLVLMDWHMPEMDGVAATQAWRDHERQQPGAGRIPIIALTASVLPGDRDACLRSGMDDFLGKPFTYDELITVVARWLSTRETLVGDPA